MRTYPASRRAAPLLALGLGLGLTLSACAGGAPTPAAAPPPVAARPQPAVADTSLTTPEYVQLGVPDPARPWTLAQVEQAVRVLSELAQRTPGALPRFESTRSGAVFARLTADAPFEAITDTSLRRQDRVRAAVQVAPPTDALFRAYADASKSAVVRPTDVIEVLGWDLRYVAASLPLIVEMMPLLEASEPDDAKRIAVFTKVRTDTGSLLTYSLQGLRDKDELTSADRQRLLGHFQATFPTLAPLLDANLQNELMTSLRSLDADPGLADLDPELGYLIEETKRASELAAPAAGGSD